MDLVFEPTGLYTSTDLNTGFSSTDPIGTTKTFDFAMYERFWRSGAAVPRQLSDGIAFATHDAYIADHLRTWLDRNEPSLVGIMGGHSVARNDPAYVAIANLARTLTNSGFTVVTGGGPGAMEAAHLGAAVSGRDDRVLSAALLSLATRANLPILDDLLDEKTGAIDRVIAEQATAWYKAADNVAAELGPITAPSLAIPTWQYGNEPTMPFATVYAKFFNNSIREQALVSRSRTGIVYARGSGGTLREIFEDLEENYYVQTVEDYTPMIFFDLDDYWRTSGHGMVKGIKIDDLVLEVVRYSKMSAHADPAPFLKKVMFGTDTQEIVSLLDSQKETAMGTMQSLLADGTPRRFRR
jgi:predicted Rossmann-fold nucleotide-binding protein